MNKSYLALVMALGSMLIGCLGDEVDVEVKPRIILQPPYVRFEAQAPSDLVAKWGPSLTDTQMNFKGYYLELYKSIQDSASDIDSTTELIATAHAPKSDTFYVFKNITPGRYTLFAYGERYPDPNDPDSVITSKLAAIYSFTFDPTPVLAPTVLMAHSEGQGSVSIRWEPSVSQPQLGMAGYVVRYRDNTSSNSLIFTHSRPGNSTGPQSILIQLPLNFEGKEKPHKIWVKGVRNDSTESVDSVVIVWSGALTLGINQPTIGIGKNLFIGQVNVTYEMREDPSGQIAVTATDSTVSVQALSNAKFAKRVDVAGYDSVYFSAPLATTDFTETSLTFPRNPSNHVWFYVLFDDPDPTKQSRARIIFVRDAPTGTLIHGGNSVRAQARFQPPGGDKLTYF